MTLFVMTRQRYEILCALRVEAATPGELMQSLSITTQKQVSLQVIALRNAGLIERRGTRSAANGSRPPLYCLTQLGEAAIQATRVKIAVQDRAFVDLEKLEVPE